MSRPNIYKKVGIKRATMRREQHSTSYSYEEERCNMLVELFYPSSPIEADRDGIALVAAACEMLLKGAVTVDELWPGQQYDPST